jgi:hypothetical protein
VRELAGQHGFELAHPLEHAPSTGWPLHCNFWTSDTKDGAGRCGSCISACGARVADRERD